MNHRQLLFGLWVMLTNWLTWPAVAQADLRVSLVTIDPGEIFWARFGHNAILLENGVTGDAALYNFGLFDFEQENFLLNFVRGRMTYQLAAGRPAPEFAYYRSIGRTVHVQELALSELQKQRLAAHLTWHRTPPNHLYRYDYFENNCSTKVRDALDLALGGQLKAHFAPLPSPATFRDQTNRLAAPEPWLYVGTQLGLGRPVDRAISRWEEFFIPMVMMRALQPVEITWEDGSRHRLVAASRTLSPAEPVPIPAAQPTWWPWFLGAGLLLAGLIWRFGRRPSIAWWGFSGLLGLGLLGLWVLTDHEAAYRNENLLLFSPLYLAALAGTARVGWLRTVAALSLVGLFLDLALKAFPGAQDNWEWIALAAPAHLAAAWTVLRYPRRREPI